MIRKAVIPAAGAGTRLRPLTLAMPKETLPIVDKPAIHHIMSSLKIAGIEDVIIVSGYKKHALMDYFSTPEAELTEGTKELDGLNFLFTTQANAIGIADAIGRAKSLIGDEPFVVIFGDTLIDPPTFLKELINEHVNTRIQDKNLAATVGVMRVEDVERWGIVKTSDEKIGRCFKVLDMVEKPKKAESPSNLAISGCYVFEPVIFEAIRETLRRSPGAKGEYQITDSMKILLERGFSIFALPLDIAHYDLGTIEDYVATFVEFVFKHDKFGPLVRERLKKKNLL
ncbi:MAG: sugar phosphate nucleotidyltransferase [Candidatus Aenigmarchaeota archaeon]|nr:sugar phosphate nucleotidyltransferase [Candidatus Aenigmarchaeota archaeon]